MDDRRGGRDKAVSSYASLAAGQAVSSSERERERHRNYDDRPPSPRGGGRGYNGGRGRGRGRYSGRGRGSFRELPPGTLAVNPVHSERFEPSPTAARLTIERPSPSPDRSGYESGEIMPQRPLVHPRRSSGNSTENRGNTESARGGAGAGSIDGRGSRFSGRGRGVNGRFFDGGGRGRLGGRGSDSFSSVRPEERRMNEPPRDIEIARNEPPISDRVPRDRPRDPIAIASRSLHPDLDRAVPSRVRDLGLEDRFGKRPREDQGYQGDYEEKRLRSNDDGLRSRLDEGRSFRAPSVESRSRPLEEVRRFEYDRRPLEPRESFDGTRRDEPVNGPPFDRGDRRDRLNPGVGPVRYDSGRMGPNVGPTRYKDSNRLGPDNGPGRHNEPHRLVLDSDAECHNVSERMNLDSRPERYSVPDRMGPYSGPARHNEFDRPGPDRRPVCQNESERMGPDSKSVRYNDADRVEQDSRLGRYSASDRMGPDGRPGRYIDTTRMGSDSGPGGHSDSHRRGLDSGPSRYNDSIPLEPEGGPGRHNDFIRVGADSNPGRYKDSERLGPNIRSGRYNESDRMSPETGPGRYNDSIRLGPDSGPGRYNDYDRIGPVSRQGCYNDLDRVGPESRSVRYNDSERIGPNTRLGCYNDSDRMGPEGRPVRYTDSNRFEPDGGKGRYNDSTHVGPDRPLRYNDSDRMGSASGPWRYNDPDRMGPESGPGCYADSDRGPDNKPRRYIDSDRLGPDGGPGRYNDSRARLGSVDEPRGPAPYNALRIPTSHREDMRGCSPPPMLVRDHEMRARLPTRNEARDCGLRDDGLHNSSSGYHNPSEPLNRDFRLSDEIPFQRQRPPQPLDMRDRLREGLRDLGPRDNPRELSLRDFTRAKPSREIPSQDVPGGSINGLGRPPVAIHDRSSRSPPPIEMDRNRDFRLGDNFRNRPPGPPFEPTSKANWVAPTDSREAAPLSRETRRSMGAPLAEPGPPHRDEPRPVDMPLSDSNGPLDSRSFFADRGRGRGRGGRAPFPRGAGFVGRGRGRGEFGRSGPSGRGDPNEFYDRDASGDTAISRLNDATWKPRPNAIPPPGDTRKQDDIKQERDPVSAQDPVHTEPQNSASANDVVSRADEAPVSKPEPFIVKSEPEKAKDMRPISPPPPGQPSGIVLALARLADLEAQMEYAYAKHMLLVRRQVELQLQTKILENLPVGMDAFSEELVALTVDTSVDLEQ